jgi:hypothetical protein
MDPSETFTPLTFDPVSLVVGIGMALLPLCLILLALGRWAWNRLARFKHIELQRVDGQPLYVKLIIDETSKKSTLDRLKELFS